MSTVRIGGIIFSSSPSTTNRATSTRYQTVALASREDAIQPANAKRSDVKRILRTAAEHFDVLIAAWEKMHP